MFNWFRKKKELSGDIEIIDKRKNKQPITPVNGDVDPIHAALIAASMQSGKAVFGKFDGKKLEIRD